MALKQRLLVRSLIAATIFTTCYIGFNSFFSGEDLTDINNKIPNDIELPKTVTDQTFELNNGVDDQKRIIQSTAKNELPNKPVTANDIFEEVLVELKSKLRSSNEPLRHPIMGPNKANESLRTQLLLAMEQEPDLVDDLLVEFLNAPNSLLGRELSSVLSQSAQPKVQQAALDLAFDFSLLDEERAAGLIMVSNMKQIDGRTRDRILEHIDSRSELTSDMQQFSLMALKPAPSSEEDYTRVHATLSRTMLTEDGDVRRHSVYQMAQWATKDSDLVPVREIALNDPDINTRARAIMSIADSKMKSKNNRQVLWLVANNSGEPPALRTYALKSLSSYTLSSDELANLKVLKSKIAAKPN
ncbi:hypothetical protein N474_02115 [Pseudoalteromonas luteoviolacea CPMOR-2]|uniref:hypothetical protein n=1 Tax=Pseudoalteromonas luteoviolacea TaxID=43657 RepID=UPI0007B0787B|nr:hypothetical protein [Pseudoalteromonas luteoviolacea]KZN54540.1 hypothetical protein N474_02115 [Pseudoalteromonas luteoviolacea CPMOR-2]